MTRAFKKLLSLKENELSKKKEELGNELIRLRGQASTGTTPKSPLLIRNTRKSIARIKTVLRQRELEKMSAGTKEQAMIKKKEGKKE